MLHSLLAMLLEHVAQGQTRFMTPGIEPDARGVVLGRYCLLSFATLEGVVSWLRLYSAEASLDELLSELEIVRVRSPLMSREFLVRIPAVSSYACDRASRLTRLLGGAVYTGSSKHFVKYRDDRSPYGYDAIEIGALPAGADFVLYGDEFVQTYARESVLEFEKLLYRLSIRRVQGATRMSDGDRNELYVAVARGLADGVIRYLWRSRVDGEAMLVEPPEGSAFDSTFGNDGRPRSYLLMKLREVPERIVELFISVPGIDVFKPVGPAAAVALGYQHPIELSSCASVFGEGTFHLFWAGDRVDTIAAPLAMSKLGNLTKVDIELERPRAPSEMAARAPALIGVSLDLAAAQGAPRRVAAALIPLEHAERLKRLVFLLPPSSLRGQRIAATDRGILIVSSGTLDLMPLGDLFGEFAPGLLVPVGMELVPRVSPDVVVRALGHTAGMITVFGRDRRPFQLDESSLQPLERRALAKIEVMRTEITDISAEALAVGTVVNDPVGRFALWGFATPPAGDTKLLP